MSSTALPGRESPPPGRQPLWVYAVRWVVVLAVLGGLLAGAVWLASALFGGRSGAGNNRNTQSPAASAVPAGERRIENGWWVSSATGGDPDGITLAVQTEPSLNINPDEVASIAIGVLNDQRGWAGAGYTYRLVTDPAQAKVVIHVTSPATTDKLCYPNNTDGKVSCTMARSKIYLNSDRWLTGVEHYPSLDRYRTYLISHEIGHTLGFPHRKCPGPGKKAYVMQQQTYGLEGCVANEWVSEGGE